MDNQHYQEIPFVTMASPHNPNRSNVTLTDSDLCVQEKFKEFYNSTGERRVPPKRILCTVCVCARSPIPSSNRAEEDEELCVCVSLSHQEC